MSDTANLEGMKRALLRKIFTRVFVYITTITIPKFYIKFKLPDDYY